jgi:soluble lytic murein transglycosylase-like protein
MAALSAAAVCVLCAAQPSPAPQIAHWQPMIAEASARFALPEDWIVRVMRAESGGHPILNARPIISIAGAMGLMQVMPATYADMRAQYGLGPNPFDPHDNILAGAAYLRAMYDRYGYPDLFAAYHAGPARFDDFLLRNRPLPRATLDYANRVAPGSFGNAESSIAEQNPKPQVVQSPSASALFFAIGSNGATMNHGLVAPPNSGLLFVPLSPRTP